MRQRPDQSRHTSCRLKFVYVYVYQFILFVKQPAHVLRLVAAAPRSRQRHAKWRQQAAAPLAWPLPSGSAKRERHARLLLASNRKATGVRSAWQRNSLPAAAGGLHSVSTSRAAASR